MWGHYILSKAAKGRSLRTGVLITPLTEILAGCCPTGEGKARRAGKRRAARAAGLAQTAAEG